MWHYFIARWGHGLEQMMMVNLQLVCAHIHVHVHTHIYNPICKVKANAYKGSIFKYKIREIHSCLTLKCLWFLNLPFLAIYNCCIVLKIELVIWHSKFEVSFIATPIAHPEKCLCAFDSYHALKYSVLCTLLINPEWSSSLFFANHLFVPPILEHETLSFPKHMTRL